MEKPPKMEITALCTASAANLFAFYPNPVTNFREKKNHSLRNSNGDKMRNYNKKFYCPVDEC